MKEGFLYTILDSLFEGVYFVDRDRRITFWNNGAERITGFSANEVIGRSCAENILNHVDEFGKSLCLFGCPLSLTLKDGESRDTNVYLHHKEGHRIPVSIRVNPIYDEKGSITGAFEAFTDISNQKQIISELGLLKKEVYLDSLTGIGNRKYGEMNLNSFHQHFLAYSSRYGVIFIDIDNFKSVNDTYGHDVGDRVLRMVAKTMLHALRPSDILYRAGGEEFVIVVPGCNMERLKDIAERVRILVEISFLSIDGREPVNVTISAGASLSEPGSTIESMLKLADEKLYVSKQSGKNRVTI